MTEEQIKKLKPGDILRETYEVQEVGEKYMTLCYQSGAQYGLCYNDSPMARQLELVQPEPTFEVGDTVRIVPDPLSGRVHGTHYSQQITDREGVIESIPANDDENTMWIHVDGYATRWGISPHCLELVKKAVKDKYYVKDLPLAYGVNLAEYPDNPSIATFNKRNHPNAEAAAEAECDRLNAEWRKQQEGKEGADHE